MNNSVLQNNNRVCITGRVVSSPVFSHEVYDEKFYIFTAEVPRLSDAKDLIKVTVSEKLICAVPFEVGDVLSIKGQFRSYNNFSSVGNRLILTVFVKDMELCGEEEYLQNPNSIYLKGYVCKLPVYRTTPFGREITDLLVAVNRSYNKSDYIPCIAWGRNAKYAAKLSVGDCVCINGRIQSRNYQKRIDDETVENKTAYEISVSKIDIDEESEECSNE